jgi:hypothetical protein
MPNVPFSNSITGDVAAASLQWPSGWGTTQNPSTRYSQSYLDSIGKYGVIYNTEWQGTKAEALQLEKMKIQNFQLQNGGALPAGNKFVR